MRVIRYNLRIFQGFITALCLIAGFHAASAQDRSFTGFQGFVFRPLRANIFEPRVGAFYQIKPEKLRLDIGNSLDLISVILSHQAELRFGADFFTFTRLRSEVNFRFPVETTDFFFGINSSLRTALSPDLTFSSRFRLAHISSHLVDGSPAYHESFVYSREFVDIVAALEWGSWRGYAGLNVVFHTIPDNFGIFTPQLGLDILDYTIFGENIGLSGGFDIKLLTINGEVFAQQSAQGGLRLGKASRTGVFIGAYWYNGKSIHGMYYNEHDRYWGLGFQIDF